MATRKTTRKATIAQRTSKPPAKKAKSAPLPRSGAKPAPRSRTVSASRAQSVPSAPTRKSKTVAAHTTWPQAMTLGGSVAGHADKPVHATKSAHSANSVSSAPFTSSGLPSETPASFGAWLGPWGQMGATASRMVGPEAIKAAIDRQFHLYQSMARLSPFTLALQMFQGLMPEGPSSKGSKSIHRP